MSVYRNRYFLLGILLVLLGVQFRMIESFVLNERATTAIARVTKTSSVADSTGMTAMMGYVYPTQAKRVEPPRWLGLALIAAGTVIGLHAVAIPKHS